MIPNRFCKNRPYHVQGVTDWVVVIDSMWTIVLPPAAMRIPENRGNSGALDLTRFTVCGSG